MASPVLKLLSTEMETLVLFTFSVLLLSAVWLYAKSKTKKAPPLPPGPLGFPVVGYLAFLRPNLHHHFTELAQKYGPIFKLQLGRRLVVVVNSPSIAKQVVRDHDAVFANRDPPIAGIIGTYGGRDILWSPNGTYWRDIRKVFVREMLSSANLRACYEHRREEVRKAIKSVKSKIGEPVNIGELASSTVINVVTRMIWGSTLGSDEAKNEEIGGEFRELMGEFVGMLGEPNISDFFPWLARFDLQGIRAKMEVMRNSVDNILEPIIKEGVRTVFEKSGSVAKGDEKKDFLQILLELKERDDAGRSLDFQAIKALLLDIVIGGTDTTATMVEWVMTILLDNPEIMKKVQKELEEIVGINNIVEEVHLPKLSYLDAVVKETFRLFPALPFLVPRCPTHTTQVGGYTIPKGTRVFLNMYAIHRDPQLWDNPMEFRPERFLNQTSGVDYTCNDHRFLPFGSGRRICAGISLAEKMLIYILSSLLHSFDWHLPKGENLDLSDKFGIVTKKNVPLIVVPAMRLSKSELYQ